MENQQYQDDWEPITLVEGESTSMPTPNPPSNADKMTNEGNVEKTTPSPTPGPKLGPSSDATMYYYIAECLLFPSLLRFCSCSEFCGLEDDDVGYLHTVNLAYRVDTTSPYPQVE